MAWTESHTVLIRHRKLVELAAALRIRPSYAIGHLHALWHVALEQQEDGDLSAWSDEFIAIASDYPGDAPQYVRLLQKHRWLDGKLIHDWLDYAGRYLEFKYRTRNPKKLDEIKAKHMSLSRDGPRSYSGQTEDRLPTYLPNLPNLPTGERAREAEAPRPPPAAEPAPTAQPPPVSEQPITNKPTVAQAKAYFLKRGFREEEVVECHRTFEITAKDGFWHWGKMRVGDWRAAMEQRMHEAREKRGGKKPPTNAAAALTREMERCAKI